MKLDNRGRDIVALSAVLLGNDTSDLLPRLDAQMKSLQRLDLECRRVRLVNEDYSPMDALKETLGKFNALRHLRFVAP